MTFYYRADQQFLSGRCRADAHSSSGCHRHISNADIVPIECRYRKGNDIKPISCRSDPQCRSDADSADRHSSARFRYDTYLPLAPAARCAAVCTGACAARAPLSAPAAAAAALLRSLTCAANASMTQCPSPCLLPECWALHCVGPLVAQKRGIIESLSELPPHGPLPR